MSLSNKNSAGLDGISNRIIKHISANIISPLLHVVNLALEKGIFPDELKSTLIIPLYKKKERDNVENYRPIALNSSLSKILEKAFLNRTLPFWNKHNVMASNQFGYKTDSSTIDAIIKAHDQIQKSMSENKLVLAIFLDLSKAFDCVEHATLLPILWRYGIRGSAYNFVKTYLSQRKQCVGIESRHNGQKRKMLSEMETLHNFSVPQGSLMGPYFFNIYTNATQRVIEQLGGSAIIYVDDTTILLEGDSKQDLETKAKTVIHGIRNYFISLNLSLNLEKTVLIIFGNSQIQIKLEVVIDNETDEVIIIKSVDSTKFLGMEIHRTLTWSSHINILISKLHSSLFVLDQLCLSVLPKEIRKSYFALFHSHLTYGLILWSHNITDANFLQIFRLQKTAIRIVKNGSRQILSCRGMFKELNIMTLTGMIILQNAIYAKRKLEHLSNSTVHSHFTRRRHDVHLNFSRNSISYMAGLMFNKLPLSLRNMNFKKFKSSLKSILIKCEFYNMQDFWDFNFGDM